MYSQQSKRSQWIKEKCGEMWTIILISTVTVLCLMFFASYAVNSGDYIQVISINTKVPPQYVVGPKYLSLGLDSVIIARGFKNFNFTDLKLMKLMKYLSPGYLRVGGNLADKLLFSPLNISETRDITGKSFNYELGPNFTMTGSQWLNLVHLAETVDLDIIFDLNSLIRFKNGSWDSHNAEQLIEFSSTHNLPLNWELGNEPNSYYHKFNEQVNASQLAKDFIHLKSILRQYPLYRDSLLVGPDVDRLIPRNKQSQTYLETFLQGGGGHILNAITWHQYYFNGRTADQEDFLNPRIFDTLKDQIKIMKDILKNSSHIHRPIWLGETASAYGGGAPNLSNTFIASFIWIDKLGLAAKLGVQIVIRQSIFNGYYALLDDNYNPNPDWWISLIYKQLIGRSILHYSTVCLPSVRLYVHCTRKGVHDQIGNSVTIFGANLNNHTLRVRIEGLFPMDYNKAFLYAYELTSDSLLSKHINLNGKMLKLLPDCNLPKFVPKMLAIQPFVIMPPLSVVFWVVPNIYVPKCY